MKQSNTTSFSLYRQLINQGSNEKIDAATKRAQILQQAAAIKMKSKQHNLEDNLSGSQSVIKVEIKDTEDAKMQIKTLKSDNEALTKKLADTKKT